MVILYEIFPSANSAVLISLTREENFLGPREKNESIPLISLSNFICFSINEPPSATDKIDEVFSIV